MQSTSKFSHRVVRSRRVPQISETQHERTNAAFWTAFLSLFGLCVTFVTLWTMLPDTAEAQRPIDDIIQTLQPSDEQSELKPFVVESPEDEITVELQTSESLKNLMSTVESSEIVSQAASASAGLEGNPEAGESLDGTGTPIAGRRRQMRGTWLFEISIPLTKTEYVELLDQMGLQLAAVFEDGRIVYLENLAGTPSASTDQADQEERFYTRWSNGNLLQFDRDLFAAAGVDISSAKLVQLFSRELERRLEYLEAEDSTQPKTDSRTWFSLVRSDTGSKFRVRRRSRN